MLAHPTHERLIALGLAGMAKAFEEQRAAPDLAALSFEERVGIMADREAAERDTKRMTARLKFAALRQDACRRGYRPAHAPRSRPRPPGQARRRRLDRSGSKDFWSLGDRPNWRHNAYLPTLLIFQKVPVRDPVILHDHS